MKTILSFCVLLAFIAFTSCSTREATSSTDSTSVVVSTDSTTVVPPGDFDVQGDFDGDGTMETGTVAMTQEGEIQSKPWTFTIIFSNPQIPSLSFENETEGWTLVNETNLNAFQGDELSIFTQGSSMGRASLQVYSFSNGSWGNAMEAIQSTTLLPDSLSVDKLLFRENNGAYYYEYMDESMGGVGEEDDAEPGFFRKNAQFYASITPIGK